MNNSNAKKTNNIKNFLKKYAYTFILLLGLISAMALILIASRNAANDNVIDENSAVIDSQIIETENVVQTAKENKIEFQIPVATSVIVRDYSDEEFVNFVSLGYYAVHKAVDFSGEKGTGVFSIAKGKVLSVETSSNLGTVVVIEHENGFKSSYASLDSNVNVKAGDTVKMGQQIGVMSNSMLDEAELGVHLHFELYKDSKLVDPNLYLTLSNK